MYTYLSVEGSHCESCPVIGHLESNARAELTGIHKLTTLLNSPVPKSNPQFVYDTLVKAGLIQSIADSTPGDFYDQIRQILQKVIVEKHKNVGMLSKFIHSFQNQCVSNNECQAPLGTVVNTTLFTSQSVTLRPRGDNSLNNNLQNNQAPVYNDFHDSSLGSLS